MTLTRFCHILNLHRKQGLFSSLAAGMTSVGLQIAHGETCCTCFNSSDMVGFVGSQQQSHGTRETMCWMSWACQKPWWSLSCLDSRCEVHELWAIFKIMVSNKDEIWNSSLYFMMHYILTSQKQNQQCGSVSVISFSVLKRSSLHHIAPPLQCCPTTQAYL